MRHAKNNIQNSHNYLDSQKVLSKRENTAIWLAGEQTNERVFYEER